jgi:hypothetical protein
MHLQLFNTALLIYFERNVLHAPPSKVSDYVCQVLTCANTLVEANREGVFIWPVFVAAVEAYTPESQALADDFFHCAENQGTGNRSAMHQVIRQVWANRRRLAAEQRCDLGEVPISWREVMESLQMDLLLL